ncbi:rRNA maturation RNase YbeY [candidate division KSB1 bacterium 4484_87]|nr:MAG: rRNA maturation RNase YbeY [candidate division KSB1 bacterium 4484_87]
MVEIVFDMTEASARFSESGARSAVEKILSDHGFHEGWINIVIFNDKLTRSLHAEYFGNSETTDVMSFEFDINQKNGYMEGEVYANIEQVRRQAKDYETSPENELVRVICHGVLHLVGYDDATPEQRAYMREKEDFYLKYY